MPDDSFFANRPKKQQSLVGVPSGSLPRSPVSFSFSNVSLQIIIRSPHPRLGKFVFSDPKRVLQHCPRQSGHSDQRARRPKMTPGCVKTCTSRECAELFSLFSSFDGDRQSGSFLIQRSRDKLSTRKPSASGQSTTAAAVRPVLVRSPLDNVNI